MLLLVLLNHLDKIVGTLLVPPWHGSAYTCPRTIHVNASVRLLGGFTVWIWLRSTATVFLCIKSLLGFYRFPYIYIFFFLIHVYNINLNLKKVFSLSPRQTNLYTTICEPFKMIFTMVYVSAYEGTLYKMCIPYKMKNTKVKPDIRL